MRIFVVMYRFAMTGDSRSSGCGDMGMAGPAVAPVGLWDWYRQHYWQRCAVNLHFRRSDYVRGTGIEPVTAALSGEEASHLIWNFGTLAVGCRAASTQRDISTATTSD
jgi:hypothetical protein